MLSLQQLFFKPLQPTNDPIINAFFEQKNARYAHVIIDVQRYLCEYPSSSDEQSTPGTNHTEKTAHRILDTTHQLRDLCQKTFIIFANEKNKGVDNALNGLYLIKKEDGDILIPKETNDAFASRIYPKLFKNQLREHGITHLIVSGFHAGHCVKETVLSAMRLGFQTAVITDCVGQGYYDGHKTLPEHFETMSEHGAILMPSSVVADKLYNIMALRKLREAFPAQRTPALMN